MYYLRKVLLISVVMLALAAPRAEAIVNFGGSINIITGCVNTVIYSVLGPPNGGPYIWSPRVTKTYSFSPPRHSGQWLLGNAGPSYFCIETVLPILVHAGLLMIMTGASQ